MRETIKHITFGAMRHLDLGNTLKDLEMRSKLSRIGIQDKGKLRRDFYEL
jgi:hypothetical protein